MIRTPKFRLCLAVSALALLVGSAGSAFAATDDSAQLKALQDQINALQKQLAQIQAAQAKSAKEAAEAKAAAAQASASVPATTAVQAQTASTPSVPAATAASAATPAASSNSLKGVIKAKTGVDLTVGGFVDMTMAYRDKNQAADTGSNFNTGIPFNNSANAHQEEFRGSARASRLTLLATGNPSADTKLTGYFETDFGAAGTSSTLTQTNSYVPRVRQIFAGYEDSDLGIHLLAGQAWSLVTMNSAGIDPFKPLAPMVIDAAFMPGFNYARTPQIRFVKDFDDKKIQAAVSVESPQAVTGGLCTASATSGACQGYDSTYRLTASAFTGNLQGSVTTDVAPDIVAKVAYDPGWGHYEVFGVARFFRNTVGTEFHNNYAMGKGVGAGASLPLVRKKIDVIGNIMVGQGIGRYGSTQLPDFSINSDGRLKPLDKYTALFGVVGHPTPAWDTYLYGGLEQTFRHNEAGISNNAYGYGNYGVDNSQCNVIDGTACYAQTSSVWQITPGFWYRVYDGDLGKMQVGAQYSWTRRNAFSDSNGVNPHAIENMGMLSVRFFPF